jgi:hypothetical protein
MLNWESGKTDPPVTSMPAIIAFLGYDRGPAAATLAERMRHYLRVERPVDQGGGGARRGRRGSWGQWERTGVVPWERHRALIDEFLADGAFSD